MNKKQMAQENKPGRKPTFSNTKVTRYEIKGIPVDLLKEFKKMAIDKENPLNKEFAHAMELSLTEFAKQPRVEK